MRSDGAPAPVIIIGGGFSGTMTAVQLARRGVSSFLAEGCGRLAKGVAYSTTEPAHVLNVPSAKMSALPGEHDHFAQWLGDDGSGFAERREFGRYLGELLTGAGEMVRPVGARAVAATRDGGTWRVAFDDGSSAAASALVLAIGNQEPTRPALAKDVPERLFVNNPWGEEARERMREIAQSGGDVLLIGTGLTMVDAVLSLDEAGHRGRIHALSRRGLIPRAHADHAPAPVERSELPEARVTALWRWLRRRSGEVGFRAAVDSLRPHSQTLWRSMPLAEQQRFLRHARPWWDVHRHRIAPEVSSRLVGMVGEGRLEIISGRVQGLAASEAGVRATIARRGSGRVEVLEVAAAFNCTGPLGEIGRTEDPLLRGLLAAGEIRPDPLGIALQVDETSRAGEKIWAVGPLTKGAYWEIVAVPDIREQVAAVAADIAEELRR